MRTQTAFALALAGTMLSSPALAAGISTGDANLDQYASLIDAAAKRYGHPDPGYLMAQMKWESQGDPNAVSSDSPCGGSGPGSKSLGLFQVTPQCGEGGGRDMFDPAANIDEGVKAITGAYKHFKQAVPGCTERQYAQMAAAGYVQDWDTVTGCGSFADARQDEYVSHVESIYSGFGNGTVRDTPPVDAASSSKSRPATDASSAVDRRMDEFDHRGKEFSDTRARFDAAGITGARRDDLNSRYDDMDGRRRQFTERWGVAGAEAKASSCKPATAAEKVAFCSAAGLGDAACGKLDFSCGTDKASAGEAENAGAAAAATNAKGDTVFSDEFNCADGTKPGAPWHFFDGWGSGEFRDAKYSDEYAKCDGQGNLVISSAVVNGEFRTSYIQTFDWLNPDAKGEGKFGPGKYIEARIDMSNCKASSAWCAFWSFDPTDPYNNVNSDGNEIDIAERSPGNSWMDSKYTVNVHNGGSEDNGAWIDRDPRSGFHTYGVDWQKNRLDFYFDGRKVYSTTKGVSGSNNQALILSIENAVGSENPFAPGTSVDGPASMKIDYVRVYDGGKP